MTTHLNPKQLQEIQRLSDEGYSHAHIANQFAVDRRTIARHVSSKRQRDPRLRLTVEDRRLLDILARLVTKGACPRCGADTHALAQVPLAFGVCEQCGCHWAVQREARALPVDGIGGNRPITP